MTTIVRGAGSFPERAFNRSAEVSLRNWPAVCRSLASVGSVFAILVLASGPASAVPSAEINLPAAIQNQDGPLKGRRVPQRSVFGILGSIELQTGRHHYESRWQGVLTRIRSEMQRYEDSASAVPDCDPGVLAWRRLIESLKGVPVDQQLLRLKKAINRMARYTKDKKTFGTGDHWASPLEFLKGRADCEDFAIIKFWSLLELGFSSDSLRFAVVRDRRKKMLHAVVTVDTGARQVVLDSLFDHVVEQRFVLKYTPVYSANLHGQFAHIVSKKTRLAYLKQQERKARSIAASKTNGSTEPRTSISTRWTGTPYTIDLAQVVDWT